MLLTEALQHEWMSFSFVSSSPSTAPQEEVDPLKKAAEKAAVAEKTAPEERAADAKPPPPPSAAAATKTTAAADEITPQDWSTSIIKLDQLYTTQNWTQVP